MDILLLAKCDHFLHTESSVASLASYFNPNMTSHFLQDEKPVKVCSAVIEMILTVLEQFPFLLIRNFVLTEN